MSNHSASWVGPIEDIVDPEVDDTSVDTVMDVLADEDRREVLAYLSQADEPVEVEHLVAHVASDGASARSLADGSGRTAIKFHHVHLPKLVDTGLITYDQQAGLVRLTDVGEGIESHIQQFY